MPRYSMSSSGAFLRLDLVSTQLKMSYVEGERTVVREVVCYNLRGVMEICRLSRAQCRPS